MDEIRSHLHILSLSSETDAPVTQVKSLILKYITVVGKVVSVIRKLLYLVVCILWSLWNFYRNIYRCIEKLSFCVYNFYERMIYTNYKYKITHTHTHTNTKSYEKFCFSNRQSSFKSKQRLYFDALSKNHKMLLQHFEIIYW